MKKREWSIKKKLKVLDIVRRDILEEKERGGDVFICNIIDLNEFTVGNGINEFEDIFPELYKILIKQRKSFSKTKQDNGGCWHERDYKSRLNVISKLEKLLNKKTKAL